MLRADLRIVERFRVPLSVTEIERLVKEILKPSASSSCLRCDIRSRRRVVQFSIYQNSVTRKRADQTAQILRLTECVFFMGKSICLLYSHGFSVT